MSKQAGAVVRQAVVCGSLACALHQCRESDMRVHWRAQAEDTALHLAAANGIRSLVAMLVRAGANVHAGNKVRTLSAPPPGISQPLRCLAWRQPLLQSPALWLHRSGMCRRRGHLWAPLPPLHSCTAFLGVQAVALRTLPLAEADPAAGDPASPRALERPVALLLFREQYSCSVVCCCCVSCWCVGWAVLGVTPFMAAAAIV
jgi:hypothetical protein